MTSCQDELEFQDLTNNSTKVLVEKTVENGRFIFSSKESLSKTIEEFQDQDIEKIEREFEELYEKGFRSHKAIISPENEGLQANLSEYILQKRQLRKSSSNLFSKTGDTEDEENEDEFIADPLLASLVNENNEIVVNDTLYKFTKEKGLFFAHVKDSTYLLNYFKKESEKANKTGAKLVSTIRVLCEERAMYGGVTEVDDRISVSTPY